MTAESAAIRKARHRAKNRANGMCVDCTKPASDAKLRCADHVLINVERERKRRKRLLAESKCRRCGHADRLPGYTSCHECIAIERRAYRARKVASDRFSGKCIDCALPSLEGRPRCRKHTDMRLIVSNRFKAKQKANRGCTHCAKPAEAGRVQCRKHLDATSAARRKRRGLAPKQPRVLKPKCTHLLRAFRSGDVKKTCRRTATVGTICPYHAGLLQKWKDKSAARRRDALIQGIRKAADRRAANDRAVAAISLAKTVRKRCRSHYYVAGGISGIESCTDCGLRRAA